MQPSFDPAPAAALLADAWKRAAAKLVELSADIRPQTLAEGYDIQDRLIANLDDEVVGWKLGVGSPKAKRQAGLERAIVGRVLRSRHYRHGDTVRVTNTQPATIEFEIAFVLARDIAPDEPPVSPSTLIGATHVAVELVLARFVDRRAVGWPSFAADDAGFAALIVGDAMDPARLFEIAGSISVEANGKMMAQGCSYRGLY